MKLGTHQTMDPIRVDVESMPEDRDASVVVGASQKDDGSLERSLQVEGPLFGHGASGRCGFDAGRMSLAAGGDVAIGASFECCETFVFESIPDLGLPAAVEAFDGRLEASLVGHHEDGSDLEAETEANDPSDRIGIVVWSGEAVVVVELGVGGQAHFGPMFQERFEDELGGHASSRPGDGQAAMQGNSRKNRKMRATADAQPFDGIEAVELAVTGGQVGQVPSFWWRWTAWSLSAVEQSMTFEDASDGAHRGQRLDALLLEVSMDGRCAVLAQGASFLEPLASGKHTLLDGVWGASRLLRSGRTVLPVYAVESFSLGVSDPILDGGERNMEGACDGSHGLSTSHSGDHLASLICGELFEP